VLNLCVVSIPFLVEWMAPGQPNWLVMTCAVVPSMFMFVRFFLGLPFVQNHQVSPRFQKIQKAVFIATVVFWVFFESFLMSLHFAPDGPPIIVGFLAIGCPVYLLAMGIAMYPGRSTEFTSNDSWSHERLYRSHARIRSAPASLSD
jgi:hypothetical protein